MKTIYVRVKTKKEAVERAEILYWILRDCTPVVADFCAKKAEVRTEKVFVKYIPGAVRTDGMRCDIPCGFGALGKIMAGGKNYEELHTEHEISDFIENEEANE